MIKLFVLQIYDLIVNLQKGCLLCLFIVTYERLITTCDKLMNPMYSKNY